MQKGRINIEALLIIIIGIIIVLLSILSEEDIREEKSNIMIADGVVSGKQIYTYKHGENIYITEIHINIKDIQTKNAIIYKNCDVGNKIKICYREIYTTRYKIGLLRSVIERYIYRVDEINNKKVLTGYEFDEWATIKNNNMIS
ncbi:MAG: hypothetical protein A2Z35_02820 [Actinobacteria bacterium RBG_19FT_COMBO_36_27]|nr:MAG: hypothetical protein A2Z35_02820 [Actinobacteria bacterium RBG_19FT_COMBO_36_27]